MLLQVVVKIAVDVWAIICFFSAEVITTSKELQALDVSSQVYEELRNYH